MINWIVEHKTLCTEIVFMVGYLTMFIVNIVRSFKGKSSIDLLSCISSWICEAENLSPDGNGSLKMFYVLEKIKDYCDSNNKVYDNDYYEKIVEGILETPTKK